MGMVGLSSKNQIRVQRLPFVCAQGVSENRPGEISSVAAPEIFQTVERQRPYHCRFNYLEIFQAIRV